MKKSFELFLKDVEINFNKKNINDIISDYKDNYSNNILVFYKRLSDLTKELDNSDKRINNFNIIKKEIENININNYDSYFLVIDTIMVLAIEYCLIKKNTEAIELFNKVVQFGEKYNNYSKENYYDIINCAYSWLVYYSYEDKDYKSTKKYCNKVLSNYEKVKNDSNYFVTEKESVDICKRYLDEIKKE